MPPKPVPLPDRLRLHLARSEGGLLLALLGLLTGLVSGGVIVLFRLLVEGVQDTFLPGSGSENYEGLAASWRFLLPVAGGLLLALIFFWFARGIHVLGVAKVLERMAYHQGRFTLRGFLLQFWGAAVALISGHSVGREGPHVYLGAAAGSLLGQQLTLPHNSIRLLAGSGVAAGIAASFNTPLAGVVFALEVVMLEYTLIGFIPIILAAVSATFISNAILGSQPAFLMPPLELASMRELPLVLLLGLLAGTISAGFIQLLQTTMAKSGKLAIWWRLILAGLLAGLFGWLLPGVMGIGYDSIDRALIGELGIGLLIVLLVGKVLATTLAVGLGVPGGMIGPSLFIGAMLGSLVGASTHYLYPGEVESLVGFYALLGMGAVMGASLQAPLAALTAMLELTHDPHIILPGMLAVIVAGLTASELFGKKSLFITMLRSSGLDYDTHPMTQTLRRSAAASVMDESFQRTDSSIAPGEARKLLKSGVRWLLINDPDEPGQLLPAIDLARHLQNMDATNPVSEDIDLLQIPGQRQRVVPVHMQASLQEAYQILQKQSIEALYVRRMSAPGIWRIYGVLTREEMERAYRY